MANISTDDRLLHVQCDQLIENSELAVLYLVLLLPPLVKSNTISFQSAIGGHRGKYYAYHTCACGLWLVVIPLLGFKFYIFIVL